MLGRCLLLLTTYVRANGRSPVPICEAYPLGLPMKPITLIVYR